MLDSIPKALVFDMFGTVFDWRTSVVDHLQSQFDAKLRSQTAISTTPTISPKTIRAANDIAQNKPDFWLDFANQWRKSYVTFVHNYSLKPNPSPEDYTNIDTHHFNSLVQLLQSHGLEEFYTPQESWSISQIWHFLKPWDDSVKGMRALRDLTTVASLSNGNITLLRDLSKSSGVEFDLLLSSELFQSYKPSPSVYIGACNLLGHGITLPSVLTSAPPTDDEKKTQRGQVAMVAAHLADLKAAKECGLKTIYVARIGEDPEEYKDKERGKGWVDLWVDDGEGEGGFLEVAKRLAKLDGRYVGKKAIETNDKEEGKGGSKI